MLEIDDKIFLDDLLQKMSQGDSKKKEYIKNKLRWISFKHYDRGELKEHEYDNGFYGVRTTDKRSYVEIGIINHDELTAMHEAIHVQDLEFPDEAMALVEGAVDLSAFRLTNNDDLKPKDFLSLGYQFIAILVNQIEKMYGKKSLTTVGTEVTMKQYFKDFFEIYKAQLLGVYIEYNAKRMIAEKCKAFKDRQEDTPIRIIAGILLDCQNRLLQMFVKEELRHISNVEDAKNLLSKLQSIASARITGVRYTPITEKISSNKKRLEFLREDDILWEKIYNKVYEYTTKRFGHEDELEPYLLENYQKWRNSAKLLFCLDFGERQIYQCDGKYILKKPVKNEDGRIIGNRDEEISQEEYLELEEEYISSRYIENMTEIADAEYRVADGDYLFLKNGKYYLYKGIKAGSKNSIDIHSQKPEEIEKDTANEMIDKFYLNLSRSAQERIINQDLKLADEASKLADEASKSADEASKPATSADGESLDSL